MDHRKVGGGSSSRGMRSVPAYKKSRHHRPKRKKASHGVKSVPVSQKLGTENQVSSTSKELQSYKVQPEAGTSSRLRSVGKMAGVAVVGTTVGAAATAVFGPAVAVGAAVGGGGLYLINKGWEWWNSKPAVSEPEDVHFDDADDLELEFEDALDHFHTRESETALLHLEKQKIAQENRELIAEADKLREQLHQAEQLLENSRRENEHLTSEGAHSQEEVRLTRTKLDQASSTHKKELESLTGLYWSEREKGNIQRYELISQGIGLQQARGHAAGLERMIENLEYQNMLQQQGIQDLQRKVEELTLHLAGAHSTFTSQDLPLRPQGMEQFRDPFVRGWSGSSITDSGISTGDNDFEDASDDESVLTRVDRQVSVAESVASDDNGIENTSKQPPQVVTQLDPVEEDRSRTIMKLEREIESLKGKVEAKQRELDDASDDVQVEVNKASSLKQKNQLLNDGLHTLSDTWEQILRGNAALKQEVEQRVQDETAQEIKSSPDKSGKEDAHEGSLDPLPEGVRKLKVAMEIVSEKLAAAELAENLLKGLYQGKLDVSDVEASDVQKTISELQQFSQFGKDLLTTFDPSINPESLLGAGVGITQQQMTETLLDGKLLQKGFDAMVTKGYQGTKASLIDAMLGAKGN